MKPHLKSRHNQTGLVMIMVLLIIALMITLLGFMIEQQHLLLRRVSNQNVAEQGYHYAQGINAWAARVLNDDADRSVDYWGDDWAKFGKPDENAESDDFSLTLSSQRNKEDAPVIDFGFDGLEYEIVDLQSRYNLNNLATKNPQQLAQQKTVFLNLLELLEVGESTDRDELYGALVDWLDSNDLRNPNGVESGDYQALSTPYYAADQKLSSVGELKFVQGFSDQIISALDPYVTALPVENAKININTTSSEVLASLSSVPILDVSSVSSFLAARLDESFLGFQQGDIQQAINAIIGVSGSSIPNSSTQSAVPVPNMLQTNSQFFQINTKVTLGSYQYCMQTVVLRGNADSGSAGGAPKISVLRREHDTLCSVRSTEFSQPPDTSAVEL